MTVLKNPSADPTTDAYMEVQTVTVPGDGSGETVNFEAPFTTTPTVVIGSRDSGGTMTNAEIDNSATEDSTQVTLIGDNNVDVDVIAIGE